MRAAAERVDGVLLVDKAAGMTSHDVVAKVRRVFGQREVGHTGTLDPLATGLMLVTLGRATRLGRFLEAEDKTYDATVYLGRSTSTLDAEGAVTAEAPVGPIGEADVALALGSLVGELWQEVPAFSAVKVKGERLFSKARRGEAVDLPRRKITVHALSSLRMELPEIDVVARVSKGTYIRTLAVQIGAALGLPAYLSRLRRVAVGTRRVEDAVPIGALDRRTRVLAMSDALAGMARIDLLPREVEEVRHGRRLEVGAVEALVSAQGASFAAGDPIRLIGPDGELCAVAWAELASAELASAELASAELGMRAGGDPALRYACVLC